jgi:uncharacterized protein (DUF58 family)
LAGSELTVPLVPRRRLIGLSFGGMSSVRRGAGSDVAGSRPYQPGDDIKGIDWNASAKLSSARARDEFVVREHFAEEAPRVVVVSDRSPGMSLFPEPLPWLSKPRALEITTDLVFASALAARGIAGYLDFGDGEAFWRPPRTQHEPLEIRERRNFAAPEDNLAQAVEHLVEHRRVLPVGSFVFVLSDFLDPPPDDVWTRILQHRWDVVPVIIQDPIWEQSFPSATGIVVPFADPGTGRITYVRISEREAAERRERNERRLASLVEAFRGLDLEPVVVGSADASDIFDAFLAWAEVRRFWRGLGW